MCPTTVPSANRCALKARTLPTSAPKISAGTVQCAPPDAATTGPPPTSTVISPRGSSSAQPVSERDIRATSKVLVDIRPPPDREVGGQVADGLARGDRLEESGPEGSHDHQPAGEGQVEAAVRTWK